MAINFYFGFFAIDTVSHRGRIGSVAPPIRLQAAQTFMQCIGADANTTLALTSDRGVSEVFKIDDFYSYGCRGSIETLMSLGVKPGSNVRLFFAGANVFPGLVIGASAKNVGITFIAGGNPLGTFEKVP